MTTSFAALRSTVGRVSGLVHGGEWTVVSTAVCRGTPPGAAHRPGRAMPSSHHHRSDRVRRVDRGVTRSCDGRRRAGAERKAVARRRAAYDWLQRAVGIGAARRPTRCGGRPAARAGLGGGVVGCAVAGGEWLGHALHPLLTDLPLGCWLSAGLLDLLGGRRGRPAAQRLVALGLLFVPVTAASGLVDWTSASDVRVRASARYARSAMSSSAAPTSARGAPDARATRIAAPRGGSPAASSRGARGTSAGTSPRARHGRRPAGLGDDQPR